MVDINAVGVEAIEREGFRAHRLQLGGVSQMDHWTAQRALDRGRDRPRHRRRVPRRFDRSARRCPRPPGPVLWDRHSELRMFTFSRPLTGDEPGIVFGDDKYRLLARSKVLVNLHRSDESDADGYFEWARMVEAMANGCVVVTEASLGHEPLVAGEHFVETTLDDLPAEVLAVLDDDERRERIATDAHRVVMNDLALGPAVAELLDLIERERLGFDAHAESCDSGGPADARSCAVTNRRCFRCSPRIGRQRRAVYDQLLAEIAHRRELGRFRCAAASTATATTSGGGRRRRGTVRRVPRPR